MAELLMKGAPVSASILEDVKRRVEALKAERVFPSLAILRVGERPDAASYEAGILRRCEQAGIAVRRYALSEYCSERELTETVEEIDWDGSIHGCLILRPLPDRAMEERVLARLSPEKDVDGCTAVSMGTVFAGAGPGYAPCTAQAVVELLDYYGVDLTGRRAVVLGRSLVSGRPASLLLQRRDATVTMCHSRTPDTAALCRDADVIVAAAGRARLVDASYASPGQVVVDVGIHVEPDGKLCGDVDFASVEPVVDAITPVPGGVGAVTTAVLALHVAEAAEKALAARRSPEGAAAVR